MLLIEAYGVNPNLVSGDYQHLVQYTFSYESDKQVDKGFHERRTGEQLFDPVGRTTTLTLGPSEYP